MSWLLKIYLITVYLNSIVSSNDIILPKDYTNQDAESLAKCIVKIRDQGIVENPTTLMIRRTEIPLTNDDREFLYTLTKTIAKSVPTLVGSFVNYIHITSTITKGSLIEISFFHNCETVLQVDALELNVKYLFLLKFKLNEECVKEIENKKKYVQQNDVTFIFKDELDNKYDFLTFIPQRNEDTCNGSTAVQFNTCVAGSLDKAIVFPPKSITNLGRCPIYMGLIGSFPHVKFKNESIYSAPIKPNGIITDDVTGSDVEIMKIIAERLNANAVFVMLTEQKQNLVTYLYSNKIQVLGGGLILSGMRGDVPFTATYGVYNVVWAYAAIRPIRQWSNFISTINGIYFFVVFYISYSFIWKGITHFDGHAVSLKDTFLYGWGALVGAASLQPARSTKQKILNVTYLIMCIHLSTYFSTQLYSFLVIQKPPEMFRTHEEVQESGRNIYLRPVFRDPQYAVSVKTPYSCTYTYDCATKIVDDNGVTMFFDTELHFVTLITSVKGEARILRVAENVLLRYLLFVLGYKNLSNDYINNIATSLFEAGISEKLYIEAVGKEIVAKAKVATKITESNDYSCESGCSINFPQIAPVFYMWLVGSAFSCLVFSLELLWNIKSVRSFWIILKKIKIRNKTLSIFKRNKNTGDSNLKK